jgi:hypothetical protein
MIGMVELREQLLQQPAQIGAVAEPFDDTINAFAFDR